VDTRPYANQYLGDGDLNTYRSHSHNSPLTDYVFYADCTGVGAVAGIGIISYVVLHAYCRVTADEAVTLTLPKFVLPGCSATMSPAPPVGSWGTGTPTDCTATLTTTDGATPWTWDNLSAALADLRVEVTVNGGGIALPVTFDVGELWVEVFGPLGMPRRRMEVEYPVAPIRRTLVSRQTL